MLSYLCLSLKRFFCETQSAGHRSGEDMGVLHQPHLPTPTSSFFTVKDQIPTKCLVTSPERPQEATDEEML